jgi:hypothetical protein
MLSDDSHPSTDDNLTTLSTILGRGPLNSAPHFPSRGWAIFSGIISIIAGIVGVACPFDSIQTLAWWSSLADYPRRHRGRFRGSVSAPWLPELLDESRLSSRAAYRRHHNH